MGDVLLRVSASGVVHEVVWEGIVLCDTRCHVLLVRPDMRFSGENYTQSYRADRDVTCLTCIAERRRP